MSHIEDGALIAVRDRALPEGSAHEHLSECLTCRHALEEARERQTTIERLLAELDEPHDLSEAKASVRARLDEGPWKSSPRTTSVWRAGLGRAAAVLLLAAGAVSALPGSPVREWITQAVTVSDEGPATVQAPQVGESRRIAVPVGGQGIRVVITGAVPGSELEVIWVDGSTARIAAAEGSAFSYGEGRLEAAVAEGSVTIELPRSAVSATLEVNDQVYLLRTGDGLVVDGPSPVQSEESVVFTVPQR